MCGDDPSGRGGGDVGGIGGAILKGHAPTAKVPVAGGGDRRYPQGGNSPEFDLHAVRKPASVLFVLRRFLAIVSLGSIGNTIETSLEGRARISSLSLAKQIMVGGS